MRSPIAQWRAPFARIPLRWRLALASFGLLVVLLTALGTVITFSEEHTLLHSQATALYDEIDLAVAGGGGMEVSVAPPSMFLPPPERSSRRRSPSVCRRRCGV